MYCKGHQGPLAVAERSDRVKRYHTRSPFFRPLEGEIVESEDPPAIVLKYLDGNLRTESDRRVLTRSEIKQVAECVLKALHTLHQGGMVHTGMDLSHRGPTYTC